ncbi:class Ib ribonucleoside-diphosphate reductase assembly flavoprotein NrdI [Streptococcus oricebi]|uniref:Putative NrdI-like protein n=1 Tax=Streptococcus oricebi TaxID=1547447 RepID=A0ABS5B1F1_9STRE|nr:class Ib ribonucleoside-diphosphate reductase assembly flavoprotein NrdI [Streptococcus oricebi]MBP2622649.1 NrdI protein [Streptococcus oricebi]
MIVVYDSRTGLGQAFAQSLGYPSQSVKEKLTQPCILVTRNAGYGKIPWSTKRFIKKHAHLIKGFVVNGDRKRFAKTFCGASPLIVEKYGLHHIRDIEGSGQLADQEAVKAFLENL